MQIGMVKEKGWRRSSPFFRPRGTLLLLRHSIFFALSFFHLPPPPFSPLFIFIRHGWLAWEKEEEERWRAGVKAPEEEVAEDDFEKKGREERKRRSWVCFILPSPPTHPRSEGKRELLPRKGEGSTNERTKERTCAPNARLSKKRRGGGNFAKKYLKGRWSWRWRGSALKFGEGVRAGDWEEEKAGVLGVGEARMDDTAGVPKCLQLGSFCLFRPPPPLPSQLDLKTLAGSGNGRRAFLPFFSTNFHRRKEREERGEEDVI